MLDLTNLDGLRNTRQARATLIEAVRKVDPAAEQYIDFYKFETLLEAALRIENPARQTIIAVFVAALNNARRDRIKAETRGQKPN